MSREAAIDNILNTYARLSELVDSTEAVIDARQDELIDALRTLGVADDEIESAAARGIVREAGLTS
jgi:hypothetical protein